MWSDQRIMFQIGNEEQTTDDPGTIEPVPAGIWLHIAAVRNGDSQELYVNSQLDDRRTCSSAPIFFAGQQSDGKVSISRYTITPRRHDEQIIYYLQGTVDEVMIFDQPLLPDEIQRLYEEGAELWP